MKMSRRTWTTSLRFENFCSFSSTPCKRNLRYILYFEVRILCCQFPDTMTQWVKKAERMNFLAILAKKIAVKSNRTPARRLAGASFYHATLKCYLRDNKGVDEEDLSNRSHASTMFSDCRGRSQAILQPRSHPRPHPKSRPKSHPKWSDSLKY